jgi:hypothetical protein
MGSKSYVVEDGFVPKSTIYLTNKNSFSFRIGMGCSMGKVWCLKAEWRYIYGGWWVDIGEICG